MHLRYATDKLRVEAERIPANYQTIQVQNLPNVVKILTTFPSSLHAYKF